MPSVSQELLFPEFSPAEHDDVALGSWADEWLARLEDGDGGANALVAKRLDTPLGPMVAAASPSGLAMLEFIDRDRFDAQLEAVSKRYGLPLRRAGEHAVLDRTEAQLERYFARDLRRFQVPLDVRGTPFELDVWATLRAIPHGVTWTYADVAEAIGRPTATRAVGAANGRNRIAVIIPCHRVVGADGTLTGFAAGVWRKRRLLELESQ